MISELFLTKFSITLRISPFYGGIEKQILFCLLIVVPSEGTSVGNKGKLISSCVYFSFHFFVPAWRCISMQPAFRSRTWKCLTVFKAQREISAPAPLNPDRLLFA